jgi:hypothetical protein
MIAARKTSRSRSMRAGLWAILTLFFVAVAVWSVWPAGKLPYQTLPLAESTSATVPMLNAWTIHWNADRLACGLKGYWDAPIFHPQSGAFAFSEPQPATWAVAPIVWWSGSPMPAYHIYLIGSLVLNAVFSVRLLRTLKVGWAAAAAGGVAVLLLPMVHQYRDTVQLMPLWGVLWTLDALLKLRRRPSRCRGVMLGIAFSSVFMTCVHHGLFLTLLLGTTMWLTIPWRRWRSWLTACAVAAFVACVFLLPLLLPMRQILTSHGFERRTETVQELSANASDWSRVSPQALIRFSDDSIKQGRTLSPGWLRMGLAVVGVALVSVRRSRHRRAVLFLLMFAVTATVFSLGLNLKLGSWLPWSTLSEWVPGVSQVRTVYRFAYFTQLAVVLLAAVGLDRVWRCVAFGRISGMRRSLAIVGLILVGGIMAVEVPPAPVCVASVPELRNEEPWVTFVRETASPDQAIVCLPFAAGYTIPDFEQTTRWMLYGSQHGVPLVNGYSGFFPQSWYRTRSMLHRTSLEEDSLSVLAEAGVKLVVVDSRRLTVEPLAAGRFVLTREFFDESEIEVWRLSEPSEEGNR